MLPSSENEEAWNYLEDRFGISQDSIPYQVRKVSDDYWLVSEHMETGLEVETYGIRFLRTTGMGLKPTTYALQILQEELDKNVVEVDREELLDLLHRREMIPREMEEKGYVAIKYEGRVIGCGFYMDEKVSSRIPKGRSKELAATLESQE